MKACISCARQLPELAMLCVFCKARQLPDDQLSPTPPIFSVARKADEHPTARVPTRPDLQVSPTLDPMLRTSVPSARAARLLERLNGWNRNERTILSIAGTVLLLVTLVSDRDPVSLLGALALLVAGLAPVPGWARGLLALLGGSGPLFRLMGQGAPALVLLPSALLVHAKRPTTRAARVLGIAGILAVALCYIFPPHGMRLQGGHGWSYLLWAVYMALPIPIGVITALAVLSDRPALGRGASWALLTLLWVPVGIFLGVILGAAPAHGFLLSTQVLASSVGGALGVAELFAVDGTTVEEEPVATTRLAPPR